MLDLKSRPEALMLDTIYRCEICHEESDDPQLLKTRIRDLEQRLRRAEMEREILKKATAYFAGQSP